MSTRYVPGHEAAPRTAPRRALHAILACTGLWFLLPGRIQGAICDCPVDRGDD